MQDFYSPKIGDIAPNFTVPSTRGKEVTLKEFQGRDVVLFFYPNGDSEEACAIRDRENDLSKAGAVVLGVTTDSLENNMQLGERHKLNFPLLSDTTADLAKMYGVWSEKNVDGRRTWGVARATFWIGADGRIRKIYRDNDAAKHPGRLLLEMGAAKRK